MAPKARQEGVALVLVLWIVALLSIMATGASTEARRDGILARNAVDLARARHLAEAGVYHAIIELSRDDPALRWPLDGQPQRVTIGDTEVRIAVRDENGKVDINNAQPALLTVLAAAAGVPEGQRAAFADAILDWRDDDDLRRPKGAEAPDYRRAGLDYTPRNGQFARVQELRLVLGVTTKVYRALEPLVTVHTGDAAVNPRFAPRALLLAMPGATEAAVDGFLRQRGQTGPGQSAAPPPFGQDQDLSSSSGLAYSVSASTRLPSGVGAAVRAVVQSGGRPGQPYSVVQWRWLAAPEGDESEDDG